MSEVSSFDWSNLFWAIGMVMGLSLLGFFLLIGFAVRQVRKIDVPKNADFTETLQLVPVSIVVAIDLLDLGLDIFAAPISWLILDRLGLKALRGMAAVEALLPFTQPIPTLTLAWVLVRYFGVRF
ncbi:MAG: hypothetical protein KDE51_10610 [Anaerolineales bacterium]|nr:hypothetical protein [Anaerolineales bacterium]